MSKPKLGAYPSLGAELILQVHRRAYEYAGDGEWHDFEDVLREVGKVVPPGIAMRSVEYARMRNAIRTAATTTGRNRTIAQEGRVKKRDPQDLVRQGARALTRRLFQVTKANKHSVAWEIEDGKFRYRRLPRQLITDQARAAVIKPVLDDLAEVLIADGDKAAIKRLRESAHANGFHLKRCPKDDTLAPLPAEE